MTGNTDWVEVGFYAFMVGLVLLVLVLMGQVAYYGGKKDKDREVCETLGGYYVYDTCISDEAVLDYEGGSNE